MRTRLSSAYADMGALRALQLLMDGASMVGVDGTDRNFPAMIFSTWRTVSGDWCSIAGGVSPPICGVAMTFGNFASSIVGIWSSARPTSSRRAGNAVLAQRRRQCRLVDQIAARQIDEKGVLLHPRQGRLPDQILGLFIGDGETDDIVGARQEIVERHMLDCGIADGREGIGDQNFHAQHLRNRRQMAADAAIADDAEAAAGQLPAHYDVRHPSGMIVGGRARHAARKIDHEAEREFGHRLDETGLACVTSTPAADAAATSMLRISTAQRTKARSFGRRGNISPRPLRHAIGDDDIDVRGGVDQAGRVERVVALDAA